MFSGKRLGLARKRRGLTAKDLATAAAVSPVTITRLELGENEAAADTVTKLANALGYPDAFFYLDDAPSLSKDAVSFRKLKSTSAKERDAALAAGEIGIELYNWLDGRFNLPKLDLPEFDPSISPEAAAEALRQHWGVGYEPIANMVRLLEAKGVRVLGLDERTANVDAFSFWQSNAAYIFLNSFKSAERSIFDAGHELGHLVLHKYSCTSSDSLTESGEVAGKRIVEIEANRFASAFLMPEEDVRARLRGLISVDTILKSKKRWRVSAMALAYRLRHLSRPMLTEWQYRAICIELGKQGYRSSEPIGVEREQSVIWAKVLRDFWAERKNVNYIADELALPVEEVQMFFHGILPQMGRLANDSGSKATLRLVK